MKKSIAGLTMVGALLAYGCGDDDRDAFNDVVLLPTVTASGTTTGSFTTTGTSTSTGTRTTTGTQTGTATGTATGTGTGGVATTTTTAGAVYQNTALIGLAGAGTANTLQRFASDAPGTINQTETITLREQQTTGTTAAGGLAPATEQLVAIDFRAQNNGLYGLARDSANGRVSLFFINLTSGVGTRVATAAPATDLFDNGAAGTVNPNTTLTAATRFDIDFNPAGDRIRVVTNNGLSFRMDPNTGNVVDGDNGTGTAATGTNPDGNTNGGTTTAAQIGGAAYTNSVQNATATTLYTIDTAGDTLNIQDPNVGTQGSSKPLGINAAFVEGFDIPSGIGSGGTNNAAQVGLGFAAIMLSDNTNHLYTVDLTTGATVDRGIVGTAANPLRSLAVVPTNPANFPLIGVQSATTETGATATTTTSLIRFYSDTPGTSTPATVAAQANGAGTGLVAGEQLVGIDYRPATGQLFGFGYNATATPTTGTIYRIDPQTGTLTTIGTASASLGFGSSTVGFGFDFDPTTDLIRVVSSGTTTGTGAGATTTAGLAVNFSPIGGAQGGGFGGNSFSTITGTTGSTTAPGDSGAGYTNNNVASLTGTVPTAAGQTRLYVLDDAANALNIQTGNPVGAGGSTVVDTRVALVNQNAATVDFTQVNGFFVPGNVSVSGTGTGAGTTVANPTAFVSLVVGGNTGLYRLDLNSGAITQVGTAITGGLSGLAGL